MENGFTPKLETLPAAQQRLWHELNEVPSKFTLYGGTAIALHLGHRVSVDFDFFAFESVDPDALVQSIPFLRDATVTQKSPDTLNAIVDRGGTVQVSFFGLPHLTRLRPGLRTPDNTITVASLLDLAGTKAAVVQNRAEAKDYIDIDALIYKGAIDLSLSLSAAQAIYGPQFNPELTLKALCYYGDGTLSLVPGDVRERLVDAVRAVDLSHLPPVQEGSPPSKQDNDR